MDRGGKRGLWQIQYPGQAGMERQAQCPNNWVNYESGVPQNCFNIMNSTPSPIKRFQFLYIFTRSEDKLPIISILNSVEKNLNHTFVPLLVRRGQAAQKQLLRESRNRIRWKSSFKRCLELLECLQPGNFNLLSNKFDLISLKPENLLKCNYDSTAYENSTGNSDFW